jgi:hypothetical protein
MASPSWTTATPGSGSLTDPSGNVWTLDIGNWLRKNGQQALGLDGSLITCDWPWLYVKNASWWRHNIDTGALWQMSADPRPVAGPPPAPTPSPPNPPETNMDADIAAADALMLDRIKAQEYRNDLANLRAYRTNSLAAQAAHHAACLAKQDELRAMLSAQLAALPPVAPEMPLAQQLRIRMGEAIADKYMTTNSNTTPAGWASDAAADAGKFGSALTAAVAEVLKPQP